MKCYALLLLAALCAAPALADTHVSYVDAAGQPGMQLYVKDGKVRMENNADQSIGIFDTVGNTLLVLDPVHKRYTRFDQQSAAHLSAQFQEAQKQLDDATKKLESQGEKLADRLTTVAQHGLLQTLVGHALVDYAVKLMVPSGLTMRVDRKSLGTSQTIAGFGCDDEQVIVSGNVGETRCVAHDISKLGIPAADLGTLQTMSEDFKVILISIEPMAPGISDTMPTGLPIRSQKMTFDQVAKKLGTRLDTLQFISTAALSADLFTAPADYTQVSLDDFAGS